MPGRVIREGWLGSETINQLTARANRGNAPGTPADRPLGWLAEVVLVRLCLAVDDYGLIDGRMGPLHRRLWPLGEPTDPNELDLLEALGLLQRPHPVTGRRLVTAYEHDGKPYLWVHNFKQRARAESRCPLPQHYAQEYENEREIEVVRQMSDTCQTDVRQLSDKPHANTKVARPRARGSKKLSLIKNSLVTKRGRGAKPVRKPRRGRAKTATPPAVDNPTRTVEPATEPIARPPQQHLERTPDPNSASTTALAEDPEEPTTPEPRPILAKPSRLPDYWATSPETLHAAGQQLDMPRLKGESDGAYTARLTARIRLESA